MGFLEEERWETSQKLLAFLKNSGQKTKKDTKISCLDAQ